MTDTLDFDPYHSDLVFWDAHEFGPTVTKQERWERATIAEELVECWDRLRDNLPGTMHLVVNNACGRLVQAFGETMKLGHRDSLILMEQVMVAPPGRARRLALLSSAQLIERYARRTEAAV